MRWIKRTALAVAGLLALMVVAALVYAWRAQPALDGALKAAGLKSPVQVARDASDVTHIKAQSERDAAWAMGYTHAQERSWQLEFNRRVMRGELSEILGSATLETDKLLRSLGIMQAAKAQFDRLPPQAQDLLQAYSEGINGFHSSSSQALPPEFHILGTKPGGASGLAWTAVDSVGWSLMMALDLGGNWGAEFARLSAAQKLGTDELWALFPAYPGEARASKLDFAKQYADLGVYATAPAATKAQVISPNLIANYDHLILTLRKFFINNGFSSPQQQLQAGAAKWSADWLRDMGVVEGKGSNNWVLAGSKTASGKPLVANDPHLGLSAPAIWYFARIQSPGLDVIGATLPGLPTVILGRTAGVAWGFTNVGPDVQDLYLEQINPANSAQYRVPAADGAMKYENFITRVETIKIKGQPDLSYTARSTRHGPVVSDAQASYGEVLNLSKYALALRWSALDADNSTVLAGMLAGRAQTVEQLFKAYESYHSPMQNVVAADTTGRIHYQAIGKAPLRAAGNDTMGIAPALGWEARYDWAGWIPYAQNPMDTGTKGWVATANQRITPPNYPHFMGQDWATPQRFERIEALLASPATPGLVGGKHSLASMQAIQADQLSLAARTLIPVLQKTTSAHALAADALKEIASFDGVMLTSSPKPLIFSVWADELARGLIVPKLGQTKFDKMYGKRHFRGLVEAVMTGPDAAISQTWCAPKTCATHSSEALARALERISAMQGTAVANWQWGKAHMATSSHRPFSNVPLLAKLFDVAVPTGGDPWTVNVGQYWLNEKKQPFANRHAASLRAIYDLSDLDKSQFIYQTGQSGLALSGRYRDMSDEWAAVKYRTLSLNPVRMVHEATLQP